MHSSSSSRGYPAVPTGPLVGPPGHLASTAPDLLLSVHALERCAERGVSQAHLPVVPARPTILTPQADGTVRVSAVVSGTHARWWVEAIVWAASASHWFVLTVWRSGLRAPKARGRRAA